MPCLQRSIALAVTFVAAFSLGPGPAAAAPRLLTSVERAADIRKELGLTDELLRLSAVKNVKVAVLDAGFAGVENEIRNKTAPRYLPPSAELVETYPGKKGLPGLDPSDPHGLHLAQIVYAMTGYGEGPLFRLYNANGPENFIEAVKSLVEWKADIVVCSRNWETFGNFDGKGFIDKAVEQATDEGILWFQAAGNYHNKVANAPIKTHTEKLYNGGETQFVDLPYATSYVRFKNHVDDNNVTITLSWNSFYPGEEARGTNKDLNLYVYRAPEKSGDPADLVASSKLKQVESAPKGKDETLFPRERITKRLRASGDRDYLIAVEKAAGTFDPAKDKLRITVTGDKQPYVDEKTEKRIDPIELVDATDDGEIMVPADNRYVITVGDLSPQSAKGPTADGRGKPEILFPRSNVNFTDRNAYYGTSYAAAYMGAVAAVLKGKEPLLSRAHVLKFRTNDPKKLLKASGWDTDSPFKVLWDNAHVRSKFGTFVDWDRLAVRGNVDGYPSIGFLDAWKDVRLFANLPDDVKTNPQKYDVFIVPDVTPTVKTVQDPPTTRRGPDQQQLVTPAHYVNRSKYIGSTQGGVVTNGYVYGVVPSYNIYLNYQELVPAQYKTVPGQTYQVPGAYRQVPGDPIVNFMIHHRLKDSATKLPFETDEKNKPRASFLRLERAVVPTTEGRGSVVDGSNRQPKLWQTPSWTSLREVVGGAR